MGEWDYRIFQSTRNSKIRGILRGLREGWMQVGCFGRKVDLPRLTFPALEFWPQLWLEKWHKNKAHPAHIPHKPWQLPNSRLWLFYLRQSVFSPVHHKSNNAHHVYQNKSKVNAWTRSPLLLRLLSELKTQGNPKVSRVLNQSKTTYHESHGR